MERRNPFLDDKTRNLYEDLRKQLKGYEVYIGSTSRQEDVMVVRIYNDRNIGGYYLYNANTSDLKKIADRNPWLKEEDMTSMNPIVFTSRDGLTINGYLTLPLGKAPKNLPVVINPHGGPWARDQWGFNPEVQFLANRGYAVLQINFRGSTAMGANFGSLF
ncbi:MAG: prolyl oligopeptidase family serine peptidase [Sphingobacteriales bacterium]|nr:prolyl oligopeptidase family serine peptidase [Sphingobacteriales bacterium]